MTPAEEHLVLRDLAALREVLATLRVDAEKARAKVRTLQNVQDALLRQRATLLRERDELAAELRRVRELLASGTRPA